MKYLLVAVAVFFSGVLLSACACTLRACGSTGMEFTVHIALGRAGLEGATVDVCHNGRCSSGVPVWSNMRDPRAPMGGWEDASIPFVGALGRPQGGIQITPDGRAAVNLQISLGESQAPNGDLFEIRIIDAQGASVVDFSRRLRYQRHVPNGETCGPECYSGHIDVWPSSQNGLICDSRPCRSGTDVAIEIPIPGDYPHGTTFDVCRNELCARAIWPRLVFDGQLAANLAGGTKVSANIWNFHIFILDDPAVLADGDVYRITVTDSEGVVVAAIDKAVNYEATFPNGATCDEFPCRGATLVP